MSMSKDIIGWWSGGVTSAVTCKKIIDVFGLDNCRFIFIDTHNEDQDSYRFKDDCAKWYGKEIETISGIGDKYKSIEDVWIRFKSMNVANGAICSSELKREVREKWQKDNEFRHQAFGFEMSETKRAISMKLNYPETNPIFPLLLHGLTKKDCIQIIEDAGIDVPRMYHLGFHNNNCFGKDDKSLGGCVQGGVGYWQKMKRDFPEKFDKMAEMEHFLTDIKGKPVTMLKDQSKQAMLTGNKRLFLKPHPEYPEIKDISMLKGREPKPLMECNGFCGINDLSPRSETEDEINFEQGDLFDNHQN